MLRGSFHRVRSMASAAKAPSSNIPEADLKDFQEHLKSSDRILALLGAGLSASSGLPTFRGAGGLWRTHEATQLATPEAFQIDPGLVWQFYGYRRHMALKAKPNRAHLALAELAKRRPGFMTLSQNVDGPSILDSLDGRRLLMCINRSLAARWASSAPIAAAARDTLRSQMHSL